MSMVPTPALAAPVPPHRGSRPLLVDLRPISSRCGWSCSPGASAVIRQRAVLVVDRRLLLPALTS